MSKSLDANELMQRMKQIVDRNAEFDKNPDACERCKATQQMMDMVQDPDATDLQLLQQRTSLLAKNAKDYTAYLANRVSAAEVRKRR